MKKFKKPLIIIATIILIISSGIFYIRHRQQQEHQKMVKIANSREAKEVYEDFIKMRDPKALTPDGVVQSYEIDEETLDYNPMGGLMVGLIINGDKDLHISYNLLEDGEGYQSAYYWTSAKLSRKFRGVE